MFLRHHLPAASNKSKYSRGVIWQDGAPQLSGNPALAEKTRRVYPDLELHGVHDECFCTIEGKAKLAAIIRCLRSPVAHACIIGAEHRATKICPRRPDDIERLLQVQFERSSKVLCRAAVCCCPCGAVPCMLHTVHVCHRDPRHFAGVPFVILIVPYLLYSDYICLFQSSQAARNAHPECTLLCAEPRLMNAMRRCSATCLGAGMRWAC